MIILIYLIVSYLITGITIRFFREQFVNYYPDGGKKTYDYGLAAIIWLFSPIIAPFIVAFLAVIPIGWLLLGRRPK